MHKIQDLANCEDLTLDESDTLVSIGMEGSYPLHVRAEAVFELGKRGELEVLSDLLRFVNAPEPEIRKGAVDGIWALAKKGAIEPPLRRLLMVIRGDDDSHVRSAAVSAMETCGSEAVPHLLELLDDRHSAVRVEARRTLGKIGDRRASAPLMTRSRRGSYKERKAALHALGQMGAREAVPLLIDVIEANGPDAPIALDAAKALALIGDRTAVQYIERAMLQQLITSEKPHKDLLFSYRRLLKTRSHGKFKVSRRSCTKTNEKPLA